MRPRDSCEMPSKPEKPAVDDILAELSERSRKIREKSKRLSEEADALEKLVAKAKEQSSEERPKKSPKTQRWGNEESMRTRRINGRQFERNPLRCWRVKSGADLLQNSFPF